MLFRSHDALPISADQAKKGEQQSKSKAVVRLYGLVALLLLRSLDGLSSLDDIRLVTIGTGCSVSITFGKDMTLCKHLCPFCFPWPRRCGPYKENSMCL